MSLYRRGRIWHYDFRIRKKRYWGSTGETSKQAAKEFEVHKRLKLKGGERPIDDVALSKFADRYLKNHAANKRGTFHEENVRVILRHFGEKVMLSEIGPADAEGFIAARRRKVKPSTANRSLSVLKHMFKKAIEYGNMARNPAAGLKPEPERNHREKFLTDVEARELVEKAKAWVRPIILVALHTGARCGELLGLEWGDVDFGRGLVKFRNTKNGEERSVRMSRTCRAELEKLRGVSGPVFRNKTGKPVTYRRLYYAFERTVSRAALEGLRFHDLRHSAASFWVQKGIPLNTVREILGHKSLAMTLRYAHLAPNHQDDAMAAIDEIGIARENISTKITPADLKAT